MSLYQKVRKIFVARVSSYCPEKEINSYYSLLPFTQFFAAFNICWVKKKKFSIKQTKNVYLIYLWLDSEFRYSVAFFQESSDKAVFTKACMWLLPGILE